MPIITHTILQDGPLQHAAVVEYRSPCVAQSLSPSTAGLRWTWRVQFGDGDGDGEAEVLAVWGIHRVAAHPGENAPNVVGPALFPEPCSQGNSGVITPDAHGQHQDRMLNVIRRAGVLSARRRLYIVMQHIGGEPPTRGPDLPTGGIPLRGLVVPLGLDLDLHHLLGD